MIRWGFMDDKVISEKVYPIKNLIRRQKIQSTKGTKNTNKKHVLFVPFVCFVDNAFGRFIIVDHLS